MEGCEQYIAGDSMEGRRGKSARKASERRWQEQRLVIIAKGGRGEGDHTRDGMFSYPRGYVFEGGEERLVGGKEDHTGDGMFSYL